MADKKFTIGIETTADTSGAAKAVDAMDEVVDSAEDAGKAIDDAGKGPGMKKLPTEAKAAAGSIDALEDEVRKLNSELNKLPVGSKEFVTMAGKVKEAKASLALAEGEARKLGGTMGRKGNAGNAVLEFSRAFEDAQYGIRGVLNNIPGLIAMLGGGAGLAGILSIAAVAGTQLWERLSDEKKADDSVKTIAKPLDLLKLLKTTLQDIAKAERERASEDTVEAFERQKNAIQLESLAVQGNNALLKENLGYREKLAALESKEALRTIDQKEREGKLTPDEANKQRVGVAGKAVETELKLRRESAALEVQALADKEAAEAKVTAAARTSFERARVELENRKKETEELQRQIQLRASLDKARANLTPAQEKAFASGQSGLDAATRLEGTGNNAAAATVREAALRDLEKARDLWNEIQKINERIAKEAPRAIQAYETTDKDGNKTTIDPNRKLSQLVDGSPDGKTESTATLLARVKTLEEAAKNAEQQQAATGTARSNRENLAAAQNANASDLASRNNPALQSAEAIAAEATLKLSTEIQAKIPAAAQSEATGIQEKLRQILADGQQKGEGGETEILLKQLADLTGKNSTTSREFYQLISQTSETNAALLTEAIRLMKGIKSTQDEHSREIKGLQTNAGGQRGF